jgi:hypothetical protein
LTQVNAEEAGGRIIRAFAPPPLLAHARRHPRMKLPQHMPKELHGNAAKADFAQCHASIISHLMKFSSLPHLLEPSAQARAVAAETVKFFHAVIYEHHSEEEWELFPLVLKYAEPGEDQEWVRSMIERLTLEHRQVETLWTKMEPELVRIAEGQAASLDLGAVQSLVLDYGAHAAFEESDFLPLSKAILGRHQDELGDMAQKLHRSLKLPAVLDRTASG